MTLKSTDRFRLIIKLWLFASIAGVIWNLVPVFAKYRADQQKLAELEEQRRHPPMATVDVAEDSPWPGSTIQMTGQPVVGLDDANLPSACIQYGQMGHLSVAHRSVSVINASLKLPEVVCSFPDRSDTESLYAAAISGDGKVVAAVGEFTQVSFWNAATGELLQTIEDDFPTTAAQPDNSQRRDKHPNGLRYSSTGARLLVAAPGGCLFAIGKIDGSVELWTGEGQPLPDRPDGLVTPEWPDRPDDPSAPPKRFQRLRRMQLHTGEVRQLEFTLDCQSLVSTAGHRFVEMQDRHVGDSIPSHSMPTYDNSTIPTIAKAEVATGNIEWQAQLADVPLALALNPPSQHVKGSLTPAQLAVAFDNHNVTVMALDDGSVLKTFATRYGKSTIRTASIAFRDSVLWTVGTRYTHDPDNRSVTSVSAWDFARGQRIATAEVPGQIMGTGWNPYGSQLATVRYFGNQPSGQQSLPWAFHLWDVEIVRESQHTEPHRQ